ncbi:MAG: SAM hydrolase/SAM-dependent halogenase family protein [Pseudomonadota bacterium]
MIFLFTDFGHRASYVGQMRAVLERTAPGGAVVELTAFAPAFEPRPAAYLLAAEGRIARPGDVVLAVVDPGVGTERAPLAALVDGVWFVGPDNGLLALVARRARSVAWHRIDWRPEHLSATFHGRDLFAPVAARLARGDASGLVPSAPTTNTDGWPDDLDAVVFVDDYGNAMTGRRAATLPHDAVVLAGCHRFAAGRTFADDGRRRGFWYENAIGLVELAVREGSAAATFGLAVGTPVTLAPPGPNP